MEKHLDLKGDKVVLTTYFDPEAIHRENYERKKRVGKGFSKDKTHRHVASIPTEDMAGLLAMKDLDAIAFMEGDAQTRRSALRRLLKRFPEWQCCEGAV